MIISGLGQAAGWIIPMSWLISNERVRDYGCDSVRAAGEYFRSTFIFIIIIIKQDIRIYVTYIIKLFAHIYIC